MRINRYLVYFCVTALCLLLFEAPVFSAAHGPQTYFHPFLKNRGIANVRENRWFPLGWAILHYRARGQNNPIDPDESPLHASNVQFPNGDMWYLHNLPYAHVYTCIVPEYMFDYPARGWDGGAWDEKYLTNIPKLQRMLNTMQEFYNNTNGVWNYKMLAPIAADVDTVSTKWYPGYPGSTTTYPWDLFSAAEIPDGIQQWQYNLTLEDDAVDNLVSTLTNSGLTPGYARLAGWMLADEPYQGAGAYNVSAAFREHIHQGLNHFQDIVTANDTNNPKLPVVASIRANGNYLSYDPDKLNDLDIADYLMDNIYYNEMELLGWGFDDTVNHTKSAMDYVCDPALYGNQGFSMWQQGRGFLPGQTDFPPIEKHRYMMYAPWIYGSQGAIFYELDQTTQSNFDQCHYYLAQEASLLAPYLMEPYPTDIPATIDGDQDDTKAQFTLRKHPTNGKVLLLLCNFTDNDAGANLGVTFSSHKITNVEQLIPSYSWSYILSNYVNGYPTTIQVGVGEVWARAFILTLQPR